MKLRSALGILLLSMVFISPTHAESTDDTTPQASNNDAEVTITKATTIALRGKPFYPPEFTHFNYVKPDAPMGGTIVLHRIGTFDNFNAYSQRGDPAAGASTMFADLMASSDDDLSAYYPLIADYIEYPSDYSWITFHIDERAKFQDGESIKPSDIKFSFEKLIAEGLPGLKAYYSFVTGIDVLEDNKVRFNLKKDTQDKSRLMALCGLTVFPEHFWKDHRLDEPLKEIPVGSSAYKITDYEMGKYVVLSRQKDFWGKDLPSMKGLLNEDAIRFEYYRDETVAFEAFKAGKLDKWNENTAKRWANDYVFPAMKSGKVLKLEVAHEIPLRAQGFVFNTKKAIFKDRRVREAMTYLMDFEWMNKNLFYNQYQRVDSYFMNTDYRATGKPSETELAFLNPLKEQLPEAVFGEMVALPQTDGKRGFRKNLRMALRLFKQAGWEVKNQKLTNTKTGKSFAFELLLVSPSMEKVALPFKESLKRAGIHVDIRTVDTSQYYNRRTKHEYDMIVGGYGPYAYPSPRTTQQWHSDSIKSGFNLANVEDEALDHLMDEVLKYQEDDTKLKPLGRAIDRVLMHNYYMIPQWNISKFRIAHWDKFGKPAKTPKYDLGDGAWWVDTDKAAALK